MIIHYINKLSIPCPGVKLLPSKGGTRKGSLAKCQLYQVCFICNPWVTYLGVVLQLRLADIEGFLQELDDQSQKKAVFLLRLLEQSHLPFLPDPHGEKIESDLYALRIMTKTNPRLYYTVHDGTAVMLTGIYKKKGRIPKQTLEHCRQLIRQVRTHGGHP